MSRKERVFSKPQVIIEGVEQLGIDRVQIAQEAALTWMRFFNFPTKVTISPITEEEIRKPDGTIEKVLEHTEPGKIMLTALEDPYSGVLHAMSHSIKPKQPTLLTEPISFSDGTIYGYHGLVLLIERPNGEKVTFTPFDEGMAERNASYFPGYTVSAFHYWEVGKLTRAFFPQERFSDALRWIATNDVPSFLKNFLKEKHPELRNKHVPLNTARIEEVMTHYDNVWKRRQ